MAWMRAKIWPTRPGDKAAVGSSSSSSFGPRHQRTGEGELLALAAGKRARPHAAAIRQCGEPLEHLGDPRRPVGDAFDHAQVVQHRAGRRTRWRPAARSRCRSPGGPRARVASGRRPSNTRVPRQRGTRPISALISVDLPAPFVPATVTISPCSTCSVDPAEDVHLAVAAGQVERSRAGSCGPADIGVLHRRVGEHVGRGDRTRSAGRDP